MTQKISKALAAQMVREYNGSQFFSVTFKKRTDGSIREMVCRKGVGKYTKGGSLAFDPAKKNLVVVWDAQVEDPAKAYRMISVDALMAIKMNGNSFEVVED